MTILSSTDTDRWSLFDRLRAIGTGTWPERLARYNCSVSISLTYRSAFSFTSGFLRKRQDIVEDCVYKAVEGQKYKYVEMFFSKDVLDGYFQD